ncbi:MAG: hypothetical protein D6820_11985 [Lentisphaerae bacterium]|nr:MAG: hypothetical protein D6820_11985 [Lentisphaerota bacterium]
MLFKNEGCAVQRAKALEEGKSSVVHVNADEIKAENEGKLVHFTAKAETKDWLSDDETGLRLKAIVLARDVQMYQWKEDQETKTKKAMGGKKRTITTYRYHKEWSDSLINSSSFKKKERHMNPAEMRISNKKTYAKNVYAGAFLLSDSFVRDFSPTEPVKLSEANVESLKQFLGESVKDVHLINDGTLLYVGKDPNDPKVGDLKISFTKLTSATVSVVGKQEGNKIVPYQTKSGQSIALLYMGTKSAADIFKAEEKKNEMFTWVLRIVGFLIMMFGIYSLFYPIVVVMDVIPILGDITGVLFGFIAFLLAACGSLLVIAAGWLFYRPLLGLSLLGGAIIGLALLVTLVIKYRKKKPAKKRKKKASAA